MFENDLYSLCVCDYSSEPNIKESKSYFLDFVLYGRNAQSFLSVTG